MGGGKQKFKCKVVNISLIISLNISCGCSKEPSQWDGPFEYPQHMFWLKNKKINYAPLKDCKCLTIVKFSQMKSWHMNLTKTLSSQHFLSWKVCLLCLLYKLYSNALQTTYIMEINITNHDQTAVDLVHIVCITGYQSISTDDNEGPNIKKIGYFDYSPIF